MDDEEKKIVGCLAGLAILAIIPFTSMFRGLVLSIMWQWFIVPLGVFQIGVAHAIGFSFLVSLLTSHAVQKSEKKVSIGDSFSSLLSNVLVCAFCLLFAWVAHKFM